MTRATEGLRLAPSRAGSQIDFSTLSADDVLKGISADTRTALAAALAAPASGGAAEAVNGGSSANANDGGNGGASDDYRAAQAAERARMATVLASEHYSGREGLAANLLGTDMSAEQIVGALAAAPKAAAEPGADVDGEDRQLMRDQLANAGNPDLGGADSDPDAAAKAKANNHGWADIHAEIQASRGA